MRTKPRPSILFLSHGLERNWHPAPDVDVLRPPKWRYVPRGTLYLPYCTYYYIHTIGDMKQRKGLRGSGRVWNANLIVIRIQRRTLVIQEEVGAERRMDRLEWERGLAEVEAIG